MNAVDVVIVGSGLAGLRLALALPESVSIVLVTKRSLFDTNTQWAQGGIAAAWEEDDSWQAHVDDTLVAGAGLCRREVVEYVARKGKKRVQDLIDLGVEFDRKYSDPTKYSLHLEGGHSTKRILHHADLTGAEIMRALVAKVHQRSNIKILEKCMAIDVISEAWLARKRGQLPPQVNRAVGTYLLDLESNEVYAQPAKVVVLCCGGAGKVYLYTSNPDIASGDGIAMGWRVGAAVANMEFVQFHPTCLYHPEARNFLISEALRGAGGLLKRADGTRFMQEYDERAELAPRDIVARSIDADLKKTGAECVYLDMRHLDKETLQRKFPNIFEGCFKLGIDISMDPIPVVPAAHYFCGGLAVDLNGETTVRNLFSVGETSCTGLHGANRLASNSLLEAAVFSVNAAHAILARLPDIPEPKPLPRWDDGQASNPDEQVVISQVWDEIRRFMWNYVGIVRTTRRLNRAQKRLELVQEEIRHHYWDFKLTGDLLELRNLATVAELVVQSALKRRESRGLHFISDYPTSDPRLIQDTVLKRSMW